MRKKREENPYSAIIGQFFTPPIAARLIIASMKTVRVRGTCLVSDSNFITDQFAIIGAFGKGVV
jgi:hypothetical protein